MPGVSFIPYFPDYNIDRTFGDFKICNWEQHRDIADADTRSFLEKYFSLFRKTTGDPETRIAIVHCRDRDPFAEARDLSAISRFTNALMAAYLFNLPEQNRGFNVCSSDNFMGLYQPFNPNAEHEAAVAFQFGGYFRTRVAGSWDYLKFVSPAFVPDFPCEPVEMIANQLAALCLDHNEEIVRLFRSLEWLKLTFLNYEGFTPEARSVAMATAFETLLGFPKRGKDRYFSGSVNRLIPSPNKLPQLPRQGETFTDTAIGWWCRDFYDLRSRTVHGERIQVTDLVPGGVEHLRIALSLFEDCIYGLLVDWKVLSVDDRMMQFVSRSHSSQWQKALGININDFL